MKRMGESVYLFGSKDELCKHILELEKELNQFEKREKYIKRLEAIINRKNDIIEKEKLRNKILIKKIRNVLNKTIKL